MSPLLLVALLVSGAPAQTSPAQTPSPAPVPPESQTTIEVGEIAGAPYRIDRPAKWNGALVIYCHGYSPAPVTFGRKPLDEFGASFLRQGFAFAQSGYRSGGWAVSEAMLDTEALRAHFARTHGVPTRVFLAGQSMGSFIALALMEQPGGTYDGALTLCAPLAPASWFLARRVFDTRVVFDAYFPDILPSPAAGPPAGDARARLTAAALAALDGDAEHAEAVRRFAGVKANRELAETLVFFTYILADVQRRAGGNPFDNRSILYQGTADDDGLNARVRRSAPDPAAARYLRGQYAPTGRLRAPILAVQTTYDPLMPAWVPNLYVTLTDSSGNPELFRQEYVSGSAHCAVPRPAVSDAFGRLVAWQASR